MMPHCKRPDDGTNQTVSSLLHAKQKWLLQFILLEILKKNKTKAFPVIELAHYFFFILFFMILFVCSVSKQMTVSKHPYFSL